MIAWLLLSAALAPIEAEDTSIGASNVRTISWTDASGERRSVSILTNNARIIRYSYRINGADVVDNEVPNYGIGNMVDHGSCGAGAVVSWSDTGDYTAHAVFEGPHHYVWESTYDMPMCRVSGAYHLTNQYVFMSGSDHFIQTVSYDVSEVPTTMLGDDMRGPYNQTDWPKGDITGFGFGTEYKFKTTGAISNGNANNAGEVKVNWSWTEPNTVPYVWEWASGSDREYGVVQNQTYLEQDMGGGYYNGGASFAAAPPLSGTALPAAWALPTQMSAYDSNYRSGRITWGGVYEVFRNHRKNDTGSINDVGGDKWPLNAWSWTHIVGKASAHAVEARVSDTEHIYSATLTASVGSVVTQGPRGPGSSTQLSTITWAQPGYDFIYRSWNILAALDAATFTLTLTGALERPSFVIHGVDSDAAVSAHVLSKDGTRLTPDVDYAASYDAASKRLWITLLSTLPVGATTLSFAHAVDAPPAPTGVSGPSSASGPSGASETPVTPDDPPAGCGCKGTNADTLLWAAVLGFRMVGRGRRARARGARACPSICS